MSFRVAALGWIQAIVLALWSPCAFGAESPQAMRVVVLHSGKLDWVEARRSVEAELAATGFQVLPRSSVASTPGQLIDELRDAVRQAPGVRGSVAVFEESKLGRAYVWIPEAENLFQVDVPPDAARIAPEVLSLRIVELLRVRLLGEEPELSPLPPPPPAVKHDQPSALWLAAGPLLAPSLDVPPLEVGAGVTLSLIKPLQLDASGFLSVSSGSSATRVGTIEIDASQIAVHAMAAGRPLSSLELAAGVGAGALFFRGQGESAPGFVGVARRETVGYLSLRTRAQFRFGGFALLLLVEPGVTAQALSIRADNQELLNFGRPTFLVLGGLAWLGSNDSS